MSVNTNVNRMVYVIIYTILGIYSFIYNNESTAVDQYDNILFYLKIYNANHYKSE